MEDISVVTLLGLFEDGEFSSEYTPMKVTVWSPPVMCPCLFEVEYKGETFYVRKNLPINWNKDCDDWMCLREEVTKADELDVLRSFVEAVYENQPVQYWQRGIFSLKPDLITLLESDRQNILSSEHFDLDGHWEKIENKLRRRRSYR